MYYISLNSSSNKKSRNPNNESHVLDLPTGTKLYVGSRLHDKNRKIRSDTLFFRPNGILPANGLTKKKVKSILIKQITQSTKQPILLKKREKRRRQ
jgi:hypothetical protein